MIKAVIFDMDGLLIETSTFWKEAEITVLNKYGVPLTITMTSETPSGLREDEIVRYWYDRYPWQGATVADVTDEIEHLVAIKVKAHGKALPGVYKVIENLTAKGLPLAIASSSSRAVIDAVTEKLDIAKYIKTACSAYDDEHGKPHPAVYLRTLDRLKALLGCELDPTECLVFEDSLNGVKAAKAAGMKCIAVPHKKNLQDRNFSIADEIIESLDYFTAF